MVKSIHTIGELLRVLAQTRQQRLLSQILSQPLGARLVLPKTLWQKEILPDADYELDDNHHFTIVLPPIKCKIIDDQEFTSDPLTQYRFQGLRHVFYAQIVEHKVKHWDTPAKARFSYAYLLLKKEEERLEKLQTPHPSLDLIKARLAQLDGTGLVVA